LTNLVLVEELGIRPGAYGVIDAAEAVEKNHDVPLRIDYAQENSIAFEEVGIPNGQGEERNTQVK
jgi:hypothetical protein